MKSQLQIIFGDEIIPLEIVNEVPLEAKVKQSAHNYAFQIISEWFDRLKGLDSSSKQFEFEKTIGQIVHENGRVKNVRGLWPRDFTDNKNERIYKFVYDQAETGVVVYVTREEYARLQQTAVRFAALGIVFGFVAASAFALIVVRLLTP